MQVILTVMETQFNNFRVVQGGALSGFKRDAIYCDDYRLSITVIDTSKDVDIIHMPAKHLYAGFFVNGDVKHNLRFWVDDPVQGGVLDYTKTWILSAILHYAKEMKLGEPTYIFNTRTHKELYLIASIDADEGY
jgi:hypothetical protein